MHLTPPPPVSIHKFFAFQKKNLCSLQAHPSYSLWTASINAHFLELMSFFLSKVTKQWIEKKIREKMIFIKMYRYSNNTLCFKLWTSEETLYADTECVVRETWRKFFIEHLITYKDAVQLFVLCVYFISAGRIDHRRFQIRKIFTLKVNPLCHPQILNAHTYFREIGEYWERRKIRILYLHTHTKTRAHSVW